MQTMIDYEKYENMSKKTIFNHFLKAEQKLKLLEENFKEKIKQQKELVKFLKAKTKNKLNEKEVLNKTYTIKSSSIMKKLRKDFEKLSQAEQEQVKQEVYKECGLI